MRKGGSGILYMMRHNAVMAGQAFSYAGGISGMPKQRDGDWNNVLGFINFISLLVSEPGAHVAIPSKISEQQARNLLSKALNPNGKITGSQYYQLFDFLYGKMGSEIGASQEVFACLLTEYINGVRGVDAGFSNRKTADSGYFVFIDYDKKSNEDRFYLLDFDNFSVIRKYAVAHGSGSDKDHDGYMDRALDVSKQSTSVRGHIFIGGCHTGTSQPDGIKVWGDEKSDSKEFSNTGAYADGKIIHPAEYISGEFLEKNGKAGRSSGCPALGTSDYGDFKQLLQNIGVRAGPKESIKAADDNLWDIKVIGGYIHFTRDKLFEDYANTSQYMRMDFISK